MTSKLNFISLGLALVLGTAGLPHVLMRFYTVPTAKEARRSVVWAIALIGAFYLFTLVLGYGAAAIVGPDRILAAAGGAELGGTAAGVRTRRRDPARRHLGGRVRDDPRGRGRADDHRVGLVRPRHLRQRHQEAARSTEDEQVRVSRITAVVIGVLAIGLGILANGQNIAFLVALAFAVAAAANLPTILYSLFWKRFNTSGALWSMYGGLISTIVLIVFSPAVSGARPR